MARKNIEFCPETTVTTFVADRLVRWQPSPDKPPRLIGMTLIALLLNAIILALSAPAGAQSLNWYKRTKQFLDPAAAEQFAAAKRARTSADAGLFDKSLAPSLASAFSSPPNMSIERILHTATKLMDGRVLVTGGFDNSFTTLASADLYNPNTNTWAPAAPMNVARSSHTATRLPDGRVLVTGGSDDDDNSLITTEIYNPNTNTWTFAAPLAAKRDSHAALLLPTTGKVLVTGGQSVTQSPPNTFVLFPLASAELYDPNANTWSGTASLVTAREAHTMTLLTDGTVLVVGGDSYVATPDFIETTLSSAERYNPASGTWSSAGGMSTPRLAHSATRLQNGNVLVAGGDNFSRNDAASTLSFTPLASVETYTPP